MDSEATHLYDLEEFDTALTESILNEVTEALREKGYHPIKQITGYLMSGDPGYISSYKDARKKISSIDRSKIIEFLLGKVLD
ncbi:MAG: IreB family regulatory phosphoprotein [Bacilli bacterium]|nr:IreB family regulatory phosphoprotein [Bacilli bacterium]